MFCNQCGKEISENSRFCSFCGNPVMNEEKEIINEENKKSELLDSENTKFLSKNEVEIPDDFKEDITFLSNKFQLMPDNTTRRTVFSWKSSSGYETVWSDAIYLGKRNDFDISKLVNALTLFTGEESQEYTKNDIVDKVSLSIKAALQDYNKKNKGDLFIINLIESIKIDKISKKKSIGRCINCLIEITGLRGKYNYISGRLFYPYEEK